MKTTARQRELDKWEKAQPKRKSLIKRIAPPKKPKFKWNVTFRPCATGIAIDIEVAHYPNPKTLFFVLNRASYLISWDQIDRWSTAPRGKLVTIKQPKTKNK